MRRPWSSSILGASVSSGWSTPGSGASVLKSASKKTLIMAGRSKTLPLAGDVVSGICAARSAGVILYLRRSVWLIFLSTAVLLGCDEAKKETVAAQSPNNAPTSPAPAAKPIEPVGPVLHVDAARA